MATTKKIKIAKRDAVHCSWCGEVCHGEVHHVTQTGPETREVFDAIKDEWVDVPVEHGAVACSESHAGHLKLHMEEEPGKRSVNAANERATKR